MYCTWERRTKSSTPLGVGKGKQFVKLEWCGFKLVKVPPLCSRLTSKAVSKTMIPIVICEQPKVVLLVSVAAFFCDFCAINAVSLFAANSNEWELKWNFVENYSSIIEILFRVEWKPLPQTQEHLCIEHGKWSPRYFLKILFDFSCVVFWAFNSAQKM